MVSKFFVLIGLCLIVSSVGFAASKSYVGDSSNFEEEDVARVLRSATAGFQARAEFADKKRQEREQHQDSPAPASHKADVPDSSGSDKKPGE